MLNTGDTANSQYIISNDNAGATYEQLILRGTTNTNKQLRLGYDTTNNYGTIDAITSGTSKI